MSPPKSPVSPPVSSPVSPPVSPVSPPKSPVSPPVSSPEVSTSAGTVDSDVSIGMSSKSPTPKGSSSPSPASPESPESPESPPVLSLGSKVLSGGFSTTSSTVSSISSRPSE